MGGACGTHEILIKILVEKSRKTRAFGRSECINVANKKTVSRAALECYSAELMDTSYYTRRRNLTYVPNFP